MSDHKKSPIPSDDQKSPQPERLVTPDEEAEMDVAELEHPPQAEGPRERVDPDPPKRDRDQDR